MDRNPLQRLRDFGQSVWNDNLSRDLIVSGDLQRLIDEKGIVGVTSNPTIFDKAISGSSDYDEQIRALVEAGRTTDEIYEALVVDDIRTAADMLRPVYEETRGASNDGYVSLEVSPTLAHDTDRTMEDARRLFHRVDRPNVMIKIPGTPEGLPAIEQMLYEGVNINITLLFSLSAYKEVAEAYLRALERRIEDGLPVDGIASVASFFVSRVDTEADRRLDALIAAGGDEPAVDMARALRGRLAIANAKLAYVTFKEIFESERFVRLSARGAGVQRPLWASTSTKNPDYPDTLYVDELIGPDTVQTLAPASIDAFGDHGTLGLTLESDIDGARRVFEEFEALGISYDDITATLVREGVDSFAKSFEALLAGLDEKRRRFQDEVARQRSEPLGKLADAVDATLAKLRDDDVPTRLQARDASLWSNDTKQQATIAQRLGWLPVVDRMLEEARQGAFDEFAAEVAQREYEDVILLGMGGSSLAPEVFANVYGAREGFPRLRVIDTTNPDTIRRIADDVRGAKTLFIVSTKSGTTVETMSLYRYFLDLQGGDASDFIAITDPGTPLEREATERGFWKIYRNPSDIGGRYSALSYFGLIAAASAGIDVTELLRRAATMLPVHDERHSGVWLGAVLGAAQAAGRDKLTLIASPGWEPFGDWLEQLIAESTGKDGVGIIPVMAESLGAASEYGSDRIFAYFRGTRDTGQCDALARGLRDAGHPVVTVDLDGPSALGSEFVRWEVATAVAGGLMGINPFDESNVQEAKDATNAVLSDPDAQTPQFIATDRAAAELVSAAREGGYVAILAYVDRTPDVEEALIGLRDAIRARTGSATTLGFGPRYLHSTGQLHKGGPKSGVFMQIVATPDAELEIPEAEFSFGRLFSAQSAGDAITLSRRGLPLVRVDAGTETISTLRSLTESVNALEPLAS
jgi:transaldolase / glucose-6-phosphate isomerase